MTARDPEVSALRRGLIAVLALTPAAAPFAGNALLPTERWDDLVVIDGWVLLRSDLRDSADTVGLST